VPGGNVAEFASFADLRYGVVEEEGLYLWETVSKEAYGF